MACMSFLPYYMTNKIKNKRKQFQFLQTKLYLFLKPNDDDGCKTQRWRLKLLMSENDRAAHLDVTEVKRGRMLEHNEPKTN